MDDIIQLEEWEVVKEDVRTLFPFVVVYPGKAGLPIGFEVEGLAPVIENPVWEYESPLYIELSDQFTAISQGEYLQRN